MVNSNIFQLELTAKFGESTVETKFSLVKEWQADVIVPQALLEHCAKSKTFVME
jgi:hypothetical protein